MQFAVGSSGAICDNVPTMTRTVCALVGVLAWLQAAPRERQPLKARLQAYVDEWRADAGTRLAVQINSSGPRAAGSRSPLRALYDIAARIGS